MKPHGWELSPELPGKWAGIRTPQAHVPVDTPARAQKAPLRVKQSRKGCENVEAPLRAEGRPGLQPGRLLITTTGMRMVPVTRALYLSSTTASCPPPLWYHGVMAQKHVQVSTRTSGARGTLSSRLSSSSPATTQLPEWTAPSR